MFVRLISILGQVNVAKIQLTFLTVIDTKKGILTYIYVYPTVIGRTVLHDFVILYNYLGQGNRKKGFRVDSQTANRQITAAWFFLL